MSKRSVESLALFGGAPAFTEPIHVGRPNLGDRDAFMRRIGEVLDRRWLTNDGPLVRELERRLARALEVEHCVATCNATVGMEVLAHALGLSGQIIVPAFTFIASAHAFSWLGLEPVFCDVDAATHTLDPADVTRMMNGSVSAVMGVHLWGTGCQIDELQKSVSASSAQLIFDAAHAFACTTHGRPIGGFGSAEVFSFHATKFFNTLEGGAVTTNDASLARELRLMRNFGFSGYDSVVTRGTNAKMNEISAAMGLTLLDAVPALLELNADRFAQYVRELGGMAGVRIVAPPAGAATNHQYFVMEIGPDLDLSRDQILALLWAENVRARRYFFPGCHRTEPYAGSARALPVTDRLVEQVLVLPTGGSVSEAQLATIAGLVRFAIANADEIGTRVPRSIAPGGFPA